MNNKNITFVEGWMTAQNKEEERTQRLKKEGTVHPNPNKVRTDLLAESSFFDANDLMQMKYEMLRSVRIDKQSVAETASIFGLSRVAYYRAQEQYQKYGIAGLLPYRRGPKCAHKFTAEVMSFIDEQISVTGDRPDWYILSKQIKDKFKLKVHPRSIERVVKRKKNVKK